MFEVDFVTTFVQLHADFFYRLRQTFSQVDCRK
nr:MAG TPA_asm: hypothetical protein [Caudoviricetes sp.]